MQPSPKRTVQINVKMTTQDFADLEKASNFLWPGAILTRSGIILGLAKLGAREALKKK